MTNEFYMKLALDKAWEYQGLTYPNPAVGAVVVSNGKVLSIEAHQKAGTSHAEVLALLSAYEFLSNETISFDRFDAYASHRFLLQLPKGFFGQCEIFVTLEPCSHEGSTPSCASLLQALKLSKIIIGTRDPIIGHDGGIDMLDDTTIGVLEEQCLTLIEPFLIWQNRAFVLFKLAQTSNGRIGGGYLSSKESLVHVHQMREVCSRLLIGGGTVRHDRPTLDCRFTAGKAADVAIYSRSDDFDRSIKLFDIEDREVTIVDKLDFLDKPSFVIVEGGEGMLRALEQKIDWFLIYQTPKFSTHPLSYSIDRKLDFLHIDRKGIDMMIWSKSTL